MLISTLATFTSNDQNWFQVRRANNKPAAAAFSETPVNLYKTTRRHIPEDSNLQSQCRENLKYHNDLFVREKYSR